MEMQEKVVRQVLKILFGRDTGEIKFFGSLESNNGLGLVAEVYGIPTYDWLKIRVFQVKPMFESRSYWDAYILSLGFQKETEMIYHSAKVFELNEKIKAESFDGEEPIPYADKLGKYQVHLQQYRYLIKEEI